MELERHYAAAAARLPGAFADHVARFFDGGGFPTARDEDWRHSTPEVLTRVGFEPFAAAPRTAGNGAGAAAALAGTAARFRFGPTELAAARSWVNGGSVPWPGPVAENRESLFRIGPLAGDAAVDSASEGAGAAWLRQPLDLMNRAFRHGGAEVRVPRGRDAGALLLFSARTPSAPRAQMLHPRFRIVLEPGSAATVVEVHAGDAGDGGWTNPTTEGRIGADARLDYLRVDLETGGIVHTGRSTFRLERGARLRSTVLALGAGISRSDASVVLAGEGAEADLNGLFLGLGQGVADQHTLAIHAAPRAVSRQLYKSVLADASCAIFDGKVVVAPGAVGTDASQANRNLLLSEEARVHTRPRLEILNDDVKCAHGAAIGRLDENALFYLRSRGLGRMDAREMLVAGFAGEVIRNLPSAAARELAESGLAAIRATGNWTA